MANCEFKFDHDKDPQKVFNVAKSAIVENGGKLDGDEKNGHFSISKFGMSVEGRYEINEKQAILYIDKKPSFISCDQIEGMIGQSFSDL
ncbi:hypothetical protein RCC89_03155 [Cytophagaceae bacterium ABcell3]|nr:hypothetical protein RCC89_03155 [Cytophagaceae bacterium ABcell3]